MHFGKIAGIILKRINFQCWHVYRLLIVAIFDRYRLSHLRMIEQNC